MRRASRPVRDLPAVVWLLAAVLVAPAAHVLPAPRWLMLHLLLLGAVTHSIVVWSRHFAEAVLHAAATEAEARAESRRLVLLNTGVALVLTGVLLPWWPLTVAGATAVAGAVLWHGTALVGMVRRALPSRFGTVVRYYVAAAALLPVGATLGALLARRDGGAVHERMVVAHATVNVLGWVGLTVVGTLVTLWPTMLRTRLVAGTERATEQALPLLVGAVVGSATAALLGSRPLAGAGLALYLAGLALVARPFVATARQRHPWAFPTWSVLAGTVWLVGCVGAFAVGVGTARDWAGAADVLDAVAPFFGAGFAAQVLLGAMSYLVPSVLGGGPSPVRAANAVVERLGALRVVTANTGLVVCALPLPGPVRVLAAVVVLLALASAVPLLLLAVRASRRVRATGAAVPREPARRTA